MIILTTLKQKDLAAVSAQQLLKSAPNAPVQINRFDLYDIESNATEHALIHAVTDSYIFSNPNKHHLITERSNLFNDRQLFFVVSRKNPLNLSGKVTQLNQKLGNQDVTRVTHSELWAFTYTSDQRSSVDPQTVINEFLRSTPDNLAPFAHPLIHTVSALSFDELNQKIGAFTGSKTMKLKIIIVNYNGAKFIKACFDSVLSQFKFYSDFNILVIDNASSDDSLAILNDYKDHITLIKTQKTLVFQRHTTKC